MVSRSRTEVPAAPTAALAVCTHLHPLPPPLQAYQPEELRQVAKAGQQEVAKLAREVEVLARAAQRQRAAAAAPARPWASALKRPSAA